MTQELATTDTFALETILPDADTTRSRLQAVRAFQDACHQYLREGSDYGIIPGTQRPTLLKPGAEKLAKLLNLADIYAILTAVEDWKGGFFHYVVQCKLTHIQAETLISSGLGECNSMEARYRWRWTWERDLPEGFSKVGAVFRTVKGGGKQYRVENDDPYSLVNTILKMAKKRALVDAALSAGRLSDVFTQDMEDLAPRSDSEAPETPAEHAADKTQHWCEFHRTQWFKRGQMKGYAHPIGDKEWCNEPQAAPKTPQAALPTAPPPEAPPRSTSSVPGASPAAPPSQDIPCPLHTGEVWVAKNGFCHANQDGTICSIHSWVARAVTDSCEALGWKAPEYHAWLKDQGVQGDWKKLGRVEQLTLATALLAHVKDQVNEVKS